MTESYAVWPNQESAEVKAAQDHGQKMIGFATSYSRKDMVIIQYYRSLVMDKARCTEYTGINKS